MCMQVKNLLNKSIHSTIKISKNKKLEKKINSVTTIYQLKKLRITL